MGRSKESIAKRREYTKEWFKRYEEENGITYAHAHPVSKEKRREYQRQWQKKFKEEHGMSYRDALALKKAHEAITGEPITIEVAVAEYANTLHDLTETIKNRSIMVMSNESNKHKKINSKAKGNAGERELAQLLRKQGHLDARRGQQYSGVNGDADVVGVKGIHIECKRQQKVNDEMWLKQAEDDARKGELPVVIYRRDREQWKVLIRQNLADIIWQTLTEEQKQDIRDRIKMIP